VTDRISLTAAELAFLLSLPGTAGSPTPTLLGMRAGDRTEPVIAAGLGSLLLRHLAAPGRAQEIELAPALASVAAGLADPRRCVQVSLVSDQIADGALLFESDAVRFLLAPRAYRCFDVTGVDPQVDRREPLLLLAHEFLERHGTGIAAFNVWSADPRNTWATLTLGPDGDWTFAAGRQPAATVSGLGVDEAFDRLYAELGELTVAPAPRVAGARPAARANAPVTADAPAIMI
jgi:hypothetical protein